MMRIGVLSDVNGNDAILEIHEGVIEVQLKRTVYPVEEVIRQAKEKGFPGVDLYASVLRQGIYME